MPEPGDFSARPGAAIVTGGSGGVGGEICRLLAQRGADVALSYHSQAQAADAMVTAIHDLGRDAAAWQLDLVDPDSTRRFAEAAIERFGGVHTLIHAAGPHVSQAHLSSVTPEQFRRHLEAEAAAFFNIVHPLLHPLRELQGSIVAVTSVAMRRYPPRDGLSAGPKGAVESLVRALAVEEGRYGVRANCAAPGILGDGMTRRLLDAGEVSDRDLEVASTRIPLGRLGSVSDVAEAACFLASPRASYITGQTLDVDGGYSL